MNGKMRQDPTNQYGETEICHRRQISVTTVTQKYRILQFGNLVIISTSIQHLLWFKCYAR